MNAITNHISLFFRMVLHVSWPIERVDMLTRDYLLPFHAWRASLLDKERAVGVTKCPKHF